MMCYKSWVVCLLDIISFAAAGVNDARGAAESVDSRRKSQTSRIRGLEAAGDRGLGRFEINSKKAESVDSEAYRRL